MVAGSPRTATSILGSRPDRPETRARDAIRRTGLDPPSTASDVPVMPRSRTSRTPITRLLTTSLVVATAVAVGWMIEPTGIHATPHGGPDLVVREPPSLDKLGTLTPDDADPPRTGADVPTHAIVVDSDLDLDLEFATGLGH